MSVLVINCGSTSVKASIIDPVSGDRAARLVIERLKTDQASYRLNDDDAIACPPSHADAIKHCLPLQIGRAHV